MQTNADPKTKLAELSQEYAGLTGKQDKGSRFRRRMIYGRAQSLIRQSVNEAAAQDAAFEEWQASAKTSAPVGKPTGKSKAPVAASLTGNALVD